MFLILFEISDLCFGPSVLRLLPLDRLILYRVADSIMVLAIPGQGSSLGMGQGDWRPLLNPSKNAKNWQSYPLFGDNNKSLVCSYAKRDFRIYKPQGRVFLLGV